MTEVVARLELNMTYRIAGLPSQAFRPLFGLDDAALSAINARRVVATSATGFPCRVSLEDARMGEELILVNHLSVDGATPFRASHAIYVREAADAAASYEDKVPPMLDRRMLALRCFDSSAMLVTGELCPAGAADVRIRVLLEREDVVEIHAHNPAYGCFLARVDRSGR